MLPDEHGIYQVQRSTVRKSDSEHISTHSNNYFVIRRISEAWLKINNLLSVANLKLSI